MANITGWLGGQNAKFIAKKLQELKIKLTKSPDTAVIKLSANRTKGILSDGREVNIIFSGSPGPFAVGQKIDDLHYFVRGQEFKHTGIEGGKKLYVLSVGVQANPTVNFPEFWVGRYPGADSFQIPTDLDIFSTSYNGTFSIGDWYGAISPNGKTIVLFRLTRVFATIPTVPPSAQDDIQLITTILTGVTYESGLVAYTGNSTFTQTISGAVFPEVEYSDASCGYPTTEVGPNSVTCGSAECSGSITTVTTVTTVTPINQPPATVAYVLPVITFINNTPIIDLIGYYVGSISYTLGLDHHRTGTLAVCNGANSCTTLPVDDHLSSAVSCVITNNGLFAMEDIEDEASTLITTGPDYFTAQGFEDLNLLSSYNTHPGTRVTVITKRSAILTTPVTFRMRRGSGYRKDTDTTAAICDYSTGVPPDTINYNVPYLILNAGDLPTSPVITAFDEEFTYVNEELGTYRELKNLGSKLFQSIAFSETEAGLYRYDIINFQVSGDDNEDVTIIYKFFNEFNPADVLPGSVLDWTLR